jgi:hypothetical protein
MPTPEILDFDTSEMDYREEKATDALLSHPAIYINHLEIARRLIVWTDRARKLDMGGIEFTDGFCRGLEEVAAFLRQGDFVPAPHSLTRDASQKQTLKSKGFAPSCHPPTNPTDLRRLNRAPMASGLHNTWSVA